MNHSLRHRVEELLFLLGIGILGALLLAHPEAAVKGTMEGLRLCGERLIPTLFPFCVLCNLLLSSPAAALPGALLHPLLRHIGFRDRRAGAALLLGAFGGYAVTAQTAARLYRDSALNRRELCLLVLLSCCSGPGFVVGYVGGLLLGSVRLGWMLYTLQLAANFLTAAFLVPLLPSSNDAAPSNASPVQNQNGSLAAAISGAVSTCLGICGCTIFFRVLYVLCCCVAPLRAVGGAFLSAALELSAGCNEFAALGGAAALYGCCFCLSLLGLSVFSQLSMLLPEDFPLPLLLLARLLHGFLYLGMVRLCLHVCPWAVSTLSSGVRTVLETRLPPDSAAVTAIFICLALYKAKTTIYNGIMHKHCIER